MNCLWVIPACWCRQRIINICLLKKLSFQLPYQVTRFESKEQLNDYLMGMYDTEWGQDTAKPFIMENTKLMKEYHAVSDR